jgi:hypothetical protein
MAHPGAYMTIFASETDLIAKIKLFCIIQQPLKSENFFLNPTMLDYRDEQQWDGEKLGITFL